MYPPVEFAVMGGSAAFNCNAIGVPNQNFTWMTGGLGQAQKIFNDAQHEVNSSQLTIKDVGNRGYYICDATVNINQPNSDKGFLEVIGKFLAHG